MRELPTQYRAKKRGRPSIKFQQEEAVINEALTILYKRLRKPLHYEASCSQEVATLLKLILAEEEREVFMALYLNSQHQLIEAWRPFAGSVNGAQVHPREIVKRAMAVNASAVIFSHNHPSGCIKPSKADKTTTEKLIKALSLVDVRVLDHVIIGGNNHLSFAEAGLL